MKTIVFPLLLLVLAVSTSQAQTAAKKRAPKPNAGLDARPNIVFLMSDDQSTYTMGCYGNPDVQTPNLDRLAADGMVFDHHYDTTAICMGSRANVMTGMYECKHGCNFKHGEMMSRIPDYGDDLKKMQKVYERHLDHWKSEGVAFNNYQPYTTIFDRNIDWADKVPHLEELKRKTKRR